MARSSSKSTPITVNGVLYTEDDSTGAQVGSAAWFEWLAPGRSFYHAGVSFRSEPRRGGLSWYAYKRHNKKLRKAYAGRTAALTLERLNLVAHDLCART